MIVHVVGVNEINIIKNNNNNNSIVSVHRF